MKFEYDIKVNISPQTLRRGKKCKMYVTIENATKKIAYCVGEIKGYNMRKRLQPTSDNTYTLAVTIPLIAPRGEYGIAVYAVDKDMQRGPIYNAKIKII